MHIRNREVYYEEKISYKRTVRSHRFNNNAHMDCGWFNNYVYIIIKLSILNHIFQE